MKKRSKFLSVVVLSLLSLSIFFAACQKDIAVDDNSLKPRQLSVYLTDDPCNYDSVFVDIKFVEVKIDTSKQNMNDDNHGDTDDDNDDDNRHNDAYGRWDTLKINAGVYNILSLRNGIDTLLGTANIPAGSIRKIRLTLGTNNRVVVNGVSKPLNLLAGTSKYAYIKIHQKDEDNDDNNNSNNSNTQTALLLDFDVCESIKLINGQYYLKPVLKPLSKKNHGEIEGKVLPSAAKAFVTAKSGADSATAIPENDGRYKIRGLKPGTYSVKFKGSVGYKDTTINNVQVQKNKETKLATVTLHL